MRNSKKCAILKMHFHQPACSFSKITPLLYSAMLVVNEMNITILVLLIFGLVYQWHDAQT